MDAYPVDYEYGNQYAHYAEPDDEDLVIVAYAKNEAHKDWILKNQLYNVPLEKVNETPSMMRAKYLLLRYTNQIITDCLIPITKGEYKVWTKAELLKGDKHTPYPHTPGSPAYFMFKLGKQDSLPETLKGKSFRPANAKHEKSNHESAVVFIKLRELLKTEVE